HTRPTMLSSTATTPELARLVGGPGVSVSVPAGGQAAIERQCAEVGLPAMGLWAQVPHYAAAMPYPAAAAALIDGLRDVGGRAPGDDARRGPASGEGRAAELGRFRREQGGCAGRAPVNPPVTGSPVVPRPRAAARRS